MFELDGHYSELESLETLFSSFDQKTLPTWNVMGQDVWTMDFDHDTFVNVDWLIQTVDVA